MKLKAIAVFVIVALSVTNPEIHKKCLSINEQDGFSNNRTALTAEIMEIADPVDVSFSAGAEEPIGRSKYPIALAVPAVFLVGFWLYCLLRAAQALRTCLPVSKTQPWSFIPQPIMGRVILLALVLCAWQVDVTHADDRYFEYSVTAGGDLYTVGDTVHWSVSAGVSGSDVSGINGLDATLYESMGESMNAPLEEQFFVPKHGFKTNCIPLDYASTGIVTSAFNWVDKFSYSGSGGAGWVNMSAGQFVKNEGIFGGEFCESTYTVTKLGIHFLNVNHNSGYVWVDGQDDAEAVDTNSSSATAFYVTSDPSATLGTVDMTILSNIASSTDEDYCNVDNSFCDGSDVNEDGEVNNIDLYEVLVSGESNIDIFEDTYAYQDIIIPGEINEPSSFYSSSTQSSDYVRLGPDTVFSANDGVIGEEVWKVNSKTYSDSTIDINPGSASSSPQLFTRMGEELYFIARDNDNAWTLYSLPKEEDEPILIQDNIYTGSNTNIVSLTSFKGNLYYTINTGNSLRELWRLDGVTGEIDKISNIGIAFEAPRRFACKGKYLYFVVYERFAGYSLWRANEATAESVYAFGWNRPSNLTAVGDRLYFKTLDGLWKTDGTAEGTESVAGPIMILADEDKPMTVYNELLFFAAFDRQSGIELWISDGTTGGTHIVTDIAEGPESSFPINLKALHDGVYFSTAAGPNQACLWRTDGTDAGAELLADFSSADGPVRLHQFTSLSKYDFFFLANDRLWKYRRGEVLEPVGSNGSIPPGNILHITTASDKLIIITDAGDAGHALWLYGSEY